LHADDILRGSPISLLFQSLSAESGWAKNWTRFTSTARDLAVYGTSSTLEHRTVSIPERSNRVCLHPSSPKGGPRVRILFPPAKSPRRTAPAVGAGTPLRKGGTDGSNPAPSSGESVSRPKPLSYVENPGFPRGCARLAWRLGRQRRAGCFDTAATGGNISVGPYSSTAVPLTGSARMPRRSQRSRSLLRS